MEKITRFIDIPQFTNDGSYQVNYTLAKGTETSSQDKQYPNRLHQ